MTAPEKCMTDKQTTDHQTEILTFSELKTMWSQTKNCSARKVRTQVLRDSWIGADVSTYVMCGEKKRLSIYKSLSRYFGLGGK